MVWDNAPPGREIWVVEINGNKPPGLYVTPRLVPGQIGRWRVGKGSFDIGVDIDAPPLLLKWKGVD